MSRWTDDMDRRIRLMREGPIGYAEDARDAAHGVAHTHREIVPGCYRCDVGTGVDEGEADDDDRP